MRSIRCLALIVCLYLAATLSAQTKPTEGTFESHGLTLHYTVVGQGTPVLLLPGGPAISASYMQPLADLLAPHHTAILLDQRGTLPSSPSEITPATVNLALYLEDYEALRKKLGYKQWAVVGHSFGSLCAMRYVVAHPESVSSVVLMGTLPPTSSELAHFGENLESRITPEQVAQYDAMEKQVSAAHGQEQNMLASKASSLILNAYYFDQAKAKAIQAMPQQVIINEAASSILFKEMADFDLRPQLKTISKPVLILQGRQDPLDLQLAGQTRDAIPGAKLVIVEKAGHFSWQEQPDFVTTQLTQFLR